MITVRGFRSGAILALLIISGAAVLHWPIPSLGFSADLTTGVVLTVAPRSAAEQGGLRPGERITHIYGYPWEELNTRLLVLPLPWRDGTPTMVSISSAGAPRNLILRAGRPDRSLQIEKALRLLVALVCWVTGFALGSSPQAINRQLQWVAWFWVILGAALALYQLAQTVSYVLTATMLWAFATLLAPASVLMHRWYPSRPMEAGRQLHWRRWLLAAISLLQIATLGLIVIGGSTTGALGLIDSGATLVFLGAFLLSALILGHAHQVTLIAHVRRQIRLIATACLAVGCCWTALVLGPVIHYRTENMCV